MCDSKGAPMTAINTPAVAILLFLNIRQDRRIEKLVKALMNCYKDCEDRLEAIEDKLHKL